VVKVLGALEALFRAEQDEVLSGAPVASPRPAEMKVEPVEAAAAIASVSKRQAALLEAMRNGLSEEDELFYSARDALHLRRLTAQLRQDLRAGAEDLKRRGVVTIEESEYFLTPAGRTTRITVVETTRRSYGRRYRRWRR
jgi:hypothetical protein